MSRLTLNKNEMAFRKIYLPFLKKETLTVVFRPSGRSCGNFRGYCPGQEVILRVIEKVGADWKMIPPVFMHFKKLARIKSAEERLISSLRKETFRGSSPDVQDKKSLRYHLGLIYNLAPAQVGPKVTRIEYEYIKKGRK